MEKIRQNRNRTYCDTRPLRHGPKWDRYPGELVKGILLSEVIYTCSMTGSIPIGAPLWSMYMFVAFSHSATVVCGVISVQSTERDTDPSGTSTLASLCKAHVPCLYCYLYLISRALAALHLQPCTCSLAAAVSEAARSEARTTQPLRNNLSGTSHPLVAHGTLRLLAALPAALYHSFSTKLPLCTQSFLDISHPLRTRSRNWSKSRKPKAPSQS